jgi:transcriptional regulator with XRE-family HTH domain
MNADLSDTFAVNLQTVLARKRMSQRELARLSGVHYVTINRILSRDMKPSLGMCEKLADALELPATKFFRDSGKTA